MTLRERIADWISGGALTRAQHRVEHMIERDFGALRLSLENNGVSLTGDILPMFGEILFGIMQRDGGGFHNYAEMRVSHAEAGPMVLTLQRVEGETPHRLHLAAEKRAERSEGELARIAACETPGANATVRRMAQIAREALE